MKAELITDLGAAAAVEDDWRRLAESRGSAFLTPEWYRAWRAEEGSGRSPLIVVARRDSGEVAGVLPLVLDTASRPRAIRFAGSTFGDRFGIAAAREDEEAVGAAAMRALEAELDPMPMLVLQRVEVESAWPAAMAEASGRRLTAVEEGGAAEPYVSVEGLDWEGYLAQRSVKFRQRIGRGLERRLDRDGVTLSVRETSDPADLDADMATLWRLHEMRHPGKESSVADLGVREALEEFMRGALERGWLRLRIFELGGEPAAVTLCWLVGGRYAFYQAGIDPAWMKYQPGMLLLNVTFRDAIEEGAKEIDLLLGSEDFKWRFAPEPRHVHTVVLVRTWSAARATVGLESFARRHGRRFAQHPRLGAAARRIARMLPSGR